MGTVWVGIRIGFIIRDRDSPDTTILHGISLACRATRSFFPFVSCNRLSGVEKPKAPIVSLSCKLMCWAGYQGAWGLIYMSTKKCMDGLQFTGVCASLVPSGTSALISDVFYSTTNTPLIHTIGGNCCKQALSNWVCSAVVEPALLHSSSVKTVALPLTSR